MVHLLRGENRMGTIPDIAVWMSIRISLLWKQWVELPGCIPYLVFVNYVKAAEAINWVQWEAGNWIGCCLDPSFCTQSAEWLSWQPHWSCKYGAAWTTGTCWQCQLQGRAGPDSWLSVFTLQATVGHRTIATMPWRSISICFINISLYPAYLYSCFISFFLRNYSHLPLFLDFPSHLLSFLFNIMSFHDF